MESNGGKIAAILIAAAIVIGGVVWFVTRDSDEDSSSTSTTTSESQPSTTDEAPQVSPNIVELASSTDNLSTLVTAVQTADLVSTLSGDGPFTVFAPTNDAFAALPSGTLDSLLLPENKQTLTNILTYHVVEGKVMASDLSDGQEITTVNGAKLTVSIKDGIVKVGSATVTTPDVEASNGVVHIIDTVLQP